MVLDAELGQGAADLGAPLTVWRPAGHRGVHGAVGAVGVERHGQAVALDHRPQRGHDRQHAFAPRP